eukprot:TRINITY_DN1570_c0_g1_i3.p2 TRINITY_DN1570_c0_g1~~TRINITY_DN1570_c0_g1_i3.p2  ORF type:complete len:284 (+),score=36.06 TRINITY_DN1570_c0_g1_i3:23-874(+)
MGWVSPFVFYAFWFFFFFFKQKTAYEIMPSLVGSEMCIRDRYQRRVHGTALKLCIEDRSMSEPVRLIKKYPNRRLYDTKTSAYITLGDVKDLVLKFEVFKVVDAKTGDDLTRSILLQIILEEETGGVPLFSSELLSGFVRFYGSTMQGMLGKYLENNMKTFVDFQQKLQDQTRTMGGPNGGDNAHMQADFWNQFLNFQQPAMQSMMTTYMDQSKKMFQSMQDQLQSQTRNMFITGLLNPADKEEKQSVWPAFARPDCSFRPAAWSGRVIFPMYSALILSLIHI